MADVVGKGTVLKQTIASTLTAVAQVESISFSGAQNQTVEVPTLDAPDAFMPHVATGWTEGGSVAFGINYDPALAGHQAISDLLPTPANVDWTVTYADTAVTVQEFTSAGVGFGATVDAANVLKASVDLKLTGDPGFST